jgi:hypothetical protein
MPIPAQRHPVVDGIRLLAIKALGWEELPDEDRQSVVNLINALPRDPALGDWAIRDSWAIQVSYPTFEDGDRAGLSVSVDPTGILASVTEIIASEVGSDSITEELVEMLFGEDEESRYRAAEEGYSQAERFLSHVRMIDPREGYAFSVS